MKIIIQILILALVTSCNFADGVSIKIKKLSNSIKELSGRVETTFGENGVVSLEKMKTVESFISNMSAEKRVCFSDGSCVYLVRIKNIASEWGAKIYLIKLNSNFSIDKTFGKDGFLRIDTMNSLVSPFFEKTLIGGEFISNKFYLATGNNIVRFNSDGTFDSSFGVEGVFSMVNTDHNYFPLKIYHSNDDELFILTAISPAGTYSSNTTGAALLKISKDGRFIPVAGNIHGNTITIKPYNTFQSPNNVGDIILGQDGLNLYYSTAQSGGFIIYKMDLAGNNVSGFPVGVSGLGSVLSRKVVKSFEDSTHIYTFISASNSTEANSSKFIAVDKMTGVVNTDITSSILSFDSKPVVIDDVVKTEDGFILVSRTCEIANCSRVRRNLTSIDTTSIPMNVETIPVDVTNLENNISDFAIKSFITRSGAGNYLTTFSDQRNTNVDVKNTNLSVLKFDDQLDRDNTFGVMGEVTSELSYDINLSLIIYAESVILDDSLNLFLLNTYVAGNVRKNRIFKYDNKINLINEFSTDGIIDLNSAWEIYSLELDELRKHLYLFYATTSGTNYQLMVRRINAVNGATDLSFGVNGDKLIASGSTSINNGTSAYYDGSHIFQASGLLKLKSFKINDEIGVVFREHNKAVFMANKFNLTTGMELSKSFNVDDFEEPSAAYTSLQAEDVRINHEGIILLSILFSDNVTGEANRSMLVISGDTLELEQGVGTNGSLAFKAQEVNINGTRTEVNSFDLLMLDNKFLYMHNFSAGYDQVGGELENIQMKYLHKRYKLNGEEDLIYSKLINDLQLEYDNKNAPEGEIEDYLIYSLPIFYGENFIKIITYGGYNEVARELAMGNSSESTLNQINLKFTKINSKNGVVLDHKSFDMTYADYLSNSSGNEDAFYLNNSEFSFKKNNYTYSISQGQSEEGQEFNPPFNLYKYHN